MIERLSTKTNKNGNKYQAEIDHDKKTVKYGYFIFSGVADRTDRTKKAIREYVDACISNGYKRV